MNERREGLLLSPDVTDTEHTAGSPEHYLATVREELRKGTVGRARGRTTYVRDTAEAVAAEAEEWASTILSNVETVSTELTSRINEGFIKEVKSLVVVSERIGQLEESTLVGIGRLEPAEREAIFGLLFSDYCETAAVMAGSGESYTRHMLERSPVLFHPPSYIEHLREGPFRRLSEGHFRRIVANAPQNPKKALEQFQPSADVASVTESEKLFLGQRFLADIRALLSDSSINTAGSFSQEVLQEQKEWQQYAESWFTAEAAAHLDSPLRNDSPELFEKGYFRLVRLLSKVSDRAWRNGEITRSVFHLSEDEKSELLTDLLIDHQAICQILASASERYSYDTLDHTLALYHPPAEIQTAATEASDLPPTYVVWLIVNNPKSPTAAIENFRTTASEHHKRHPFLSKRQVNNHVYKCVTNPDKASSITRKRGRNTRLHSMADALLDYVWTHGSGEEPLKLQDFVRHWEEVEGAAPATSIIGESVKVLERAGFIRHYKHTREGRKLWMTKEGTDVLFQALHEPKRLEELISEAIRELELLASLEKLTEKSDEISVEDVCGIYHEAYGIHSRTLVQQSLKRLVKRNEITINRKSGKASEKPRQSELVIRLSE